MVFIVYIDAGEGAREVHVAGGLNVVYNGACRPLWGRQAGQARPRRSFFHGCWASIPTSNHLVLSIDPNFNTMSSLVAAVGFHVRWIPPSPIVLITSLLPPCLLFIASQPKPTHTPVSTPPSHSSCYFVVVALNFQPTYS